MNKHKLKLAIGQLLEKAGTFDDGEAALDTIEALLNSVAFVGAFVSLEKQLKQLDGDICSELLCKRAQTIEKQLLNFSAGLLAKLSD